MSKFDEQIVEALISDTSFIRWAKGKQPEDEGKWMRWKTDHPKNEGEFTEAVKLVQTLSFNSSAISDLEIRYLRQKTFNQTSKAQSQRNGRSLSILIRAAAVLFIPVLLAAGWLFLNQEHWKAAYSTLTSNKLGQDVTVYSPKGTRTVVQLPDGSKAWLNADSYLTYSPVFDPNSRTVHLEGEAFFEVQKRKQPFIVENFGPSVKVYGTRFNVNSYREEPTVTVALETGSVALQVNNTEQILMPGEVSSFSREQKSIRIEKKDLAPYLAWRDGQFVFRASSLQAIFNVFERQYNVEFQLEDQDLGQAKYDATFTNENFEKILHLLELTAPIQMEYTEGYFNKEGDYIKGIVKVKAIK